MAGDAVGAEPRYWAFISYSHKDAAFGRRLHRRLESYSLPRRLVGRNTTQGLVSRRLIPIFRDREELPAATDLSAEVRAALAQSRSLIVVCSPDAAASKWVSREVELFRALHPGRPIFAAIRNGEPGECFPETLLRAGPDGERIEPLAADFREGRDGQHLGLLKLVAGIAGLGLDELVQRDAQRNTRRVTAITAAALAAVLLMGALTAFALEARKEAEGQRGEAEGLVEYMLTDLRDRLKGVGRLDVMTAVNQRALAYYKDQDLASLPVDSLERRARILHAMGEDDETRGDHKAAIAKFDEADRTTAALLVQAPNDPERIFDHAQSTYWIGYEDFQQNRLQAAERKFSSYRELALRMIAAAPLKTKYQLELAYADSNLCSLALTRHNAGAALHHCKDALVDTQYVAKHRDKEKANAVGRAAMADVVMNSLANMADAYVYNHDLSSARTDRNTEEVILDRVIATDPKNMDLKNTWIAIQRALAYMDGYEGRTRQAEARLDRAIAVANQMSRVDPGNQQWERLRRGMMDDIDRLNKKGTSQ